MARELGLDEFHAELLPGDKVDQVERLLAQKRPRKILFLWGDGINDAHVLSRADIGVAMGALGSDAAIEAADIVLMDDDLSKLAQAVRIARKTLSIVRQNIVFALAVKGLVLVLSALGYVGMWWAVFADVGVSVLAILNASPDAAGKMTKRLKDQVPPRGRHLVFSRLRLILVPVDGHQPPEKIVVLGVQHGPQGDRVADEQISPPGLDLGIGGLEHGPAKLCHPGAHILLGQPPGLPQFPQVPADAEVLYQLCHNRSFQIIAIAIFSITENAMAQ